MATAILYGKPECDLCDEAAVILQDLARTDGLHWHKVDIGSDAVLFERYCLLIPVIAVEGGPELGWPTTRERVRRAVADVEARR